MATARNTKTVKRSTKKVPIFAAVRDVRNVVFKKDNLNIPTSDALNQVMKWGKLNKIQAALFSLLFIIRLISVFDKIKLTGIPIRENTAKVQS